MMKIRKVGRPSIASPAFLFLALSLANALPAGAGTPIDRRVPAKADGTVRIENISGSVKVTAGTTNEVVVTGTLGDGTKELRVESKGAVTEIKVVLPRNARNVEDSDLVVLVPAGSSLDVETVSASIDVAKVTGAHDLQSVSGAIDVDGGTKGADVETVSGKIHVRQVDGDLDASSVSGAIEIEECRLGEAEIETVSGGVGFESELADDGVYALESTSGSVRVKLGAKESAAVSIDTFSGSISNDFDADIDEEKYGPGKSCAFTVGDGSAKLTITNLSGGVSVGRMVGAD